MKRNLQKCRQAKAIAESLRCFAWLMVAAIFVNLSTIAARRFLRRGVAHSHLRSGYALHPLRMGKEPTKT